MCKSRAPALVTFRSSRAFGRSSRRWDRLRFRSIEQISLVIFHCYPARQDWRLGPSWRAGFCKSENITFWGGKKRFLLLHVILHGKLLLRRKHNEQNFYSSYVLSALRYHAVSGSGISNFSQWKRQSDCLWVHGLMNKGLQFQLFQGNNRHKRY